METRRICRLRHRRLRAGSISRGIAAARCLPHIGLSRRAAGMAGQDGPAPETGAGPLRSDGEAGFPAC